MELHFPRQRKFLRRRAGLVLMTQPRTAVLFGVTSETASQWSQAVTPMR